MKRILTVASFAAVAAAAFAFMTRGLGPELARYLRIRRM
jgi:hypothetical protein